MTDFANPNVIDAAPPHGVADRNAAHEGGDAAQAWAPARRRLPRLDRSEVEWRNRILGLSGLIVRPAEPRLRLQVKIVARSQPGPWLRFTTALGDVGLAPAVVGNRPCLWPTTESSAILPHALAAMSGLEGLIQRLEQAMGVSFQPTGFGEVAGLQARLDAVDDRGVPVHRVWLTMQPAVARGWPPRPPRLNLNSALGRVALKICLSVTACKAPRNELGLLEPGDLIVMPQPGPKGWTASLLTRIGRVGVRGGYDPKIHQFTCTLLESNPMSDIDGVPEPNADFSAAAAITDWAPPDMALQLQVLVAGVEMTLAELSTLKPGSVFNLPRAGEDLHVEVVAEGKTLAAGRLIVVGDGYGVLIDRIAEA